jgi:hypothetical protein
LEVERLVDALKLSRASGIPIEKIAGCMIEPKQANENKIAIFRNRDDESHAGSRRVNLAQSVTRKLPSTFDRGLRRSVENSVILPPSMPGCGLLGQWRPMRRSDCHGPPLPRPFDDRHESLIPDRGERPALLISIEK